MRWIGSLAVLGMLVAMGPQPAVAGSFRDEFASFEHLDVVQNVARGREFPRITTHPDVRINRLDVEAFRDSATGLWAAMGWFPTILRLHNGELLCFYGEGREHGMKNYEARAVVSRSRDGGRTWQEASVIMQEKDWAIRASYPAQAPDGSVWINIRRLKIRGEDRGWVWAILRSEDNGRTWQQVSDRYGMFTSKALSNGKLLFLNWNKVHEWDAVRSTFLADWVDGELKFGQERIHAELGPSGDEWAVTETHNPGELVAMMRQQHHSQYYATARSHDYGRTWTPWRESNVWMSPIPSRPRLHTMPDGRLIFTGGQRSVGRTFIVVSRDNGESWDIDHRQVILHSPRQYHHIWDSHYTDAARAEGNTWLAVDYIASPKDDKLRGVYGTFIDTRYFDDVFKGVMLKEIGPPPTGKAVGWWRFDEREGNFARDWAHGHYGEIHGAQRVRGRFGQCLSFNGEDDYVRVFDEPTLWVEPHFGLEAWINTRDPGKEQVIISKGPRYRLLLRGGKPVLQVGGAESVADLKQPLVANRWYQLIVAHGFRSDYTRTTFVIDGEEISSMRPQEISSPGSLYPSDYAEAAGQVDVKITGGRMFQVYSGKNKDLENLTVGLDNDLLSKPFDGLIDEVVIYGKQLRHWDVADRVPRRYLSRGAITSEPVTKPAGSQWKAFDAQTAEPEGTQVRFWILDVAGQPLRADVRPGADLTGIEADSIVLRAELSTTDEGQTPILHGWSASTSQAAPAVHADPFPRGTAPPPEPPPDQRAPG